MSNYLTALRLGAQGRRAVLHMLVLSILAVVFLLDWFTPANLVFNALYLLAMLPALALRSRSSNWIIVVLSSLLTIVAGVYGAAPMTEHSDLATWLNRGVVILGFALAGLFVDLHLRGIMGRLAAERTAKREGILSRKALAALRESEEQLHFIAERAQVGYWHWDIPTDELEWSPLCRAIFDIADDEPMSYARFLSAVHPADREATDRAVKECLSGNGKVDYDVEYRVIWPDESVRWVHAKGNAVFEGAVAVRFAGIVLDISARKAISQNAIALAAELRQTLELAPIGLTRLSRELRYLSANEAYARISGVPVAQIIGRTMAEVMGDAALEKIKPYIEQVLAGEPVEYDVELPWKASGPRWISVAYRPWREPDGSVSGWLASVNDISERRRLDDMIRARSAELETVLEAVPTAVWIARDPEARVIQGNRFAHDLLRIATGANLSKSAPVGEAPSHFKVLNEAGQEVPPENLPVQTAARTGQSQRGVREDLLFDDGLRVTLFGNAEPLRAPSGEVTGAVAAFVDITELAMAQHELSLENRRKDEFLATLAHELRNPLAPVRYAAAMLRPGAPAAALEKARETIERQTAHLARLLDDLLDVSRITRNVVTLQRETLDLKNAVQLALEQVRPTMQARTHRVAMSLPLEPVWVEADLARVAQMLGNLLSNAAKYTESGGAITVSLTTEGPCAIVRVEDSGIGFSAQDKPQLFGLFSQLHRGSAMAQGGLGIGLAVVRQLAHLHGGEVSASSPGVGQGSTFSISLPLTRAPFVDRPAVATGEVVTLFRRHVKVQIVEDNLDAADSLAVLLRAEGVSVQVANSGAEALRLAEVSHPDVVVLDIGLPDVSGIEVARQLRSRPWASGLRMVAVSGWATPEDRRRSKEAGIDLHLAKPVEPSVLLAFIDSSPSSPEEKARPVGHS